MSKTWLEKIGSHSWPVARAKDVDAQPLRILLHGTALVLFRGEYGALQALLDVCPHRGAPLSSGICTDGKLRCAYHGWLFDGAGKCHEMPGLQLNKVTAPLVQSLHACEFQGAIWISLKQIKPATQLAAWQFARTVILTTPIQTTLQEAAENFLDPFHTHFVHGGWVRGVDASKRQRIKVKVSPTARDASFTDGVEAVYFDTGQNGWLSKLFEPARTHSIGRFLLPAVAEVAYFDGDTCTFAASAWLVPTQEGQMQVTAWVGAKSLFIPAWLQKKLMQWLFQKIIAQDIEIVEACSANRKRYPEFSPMSTKLDLLSGQIQSLLRGDSVASFGTEVLI